MYSTLKKSLVCLVALAMLSLAAGAALAEGGDIAVVDLARAVKECKQGKAIMAELKRKTSKYQADLKAMGEELEALRKDLENTAMLLNAEAKLTKEREFERKVRRFNEKKADANRELQDAQRINLGPVERGIVDVIQEIGKARGFKAVVPRQVVVYASDGIDITNEVIAAYDKKNP